MNFIRKNGPLIIFSVALISMVLFVRATDSSSEKKEWRSLKDDVTLFLASDLGRNGYFSQKNVAATMGTMADAVGPECVIAAGDVHHYMGIESTSDPLWTTNFELIYSHPELQVPWYPICGNHEYRGNTQAFVDYSNVSRRWQMEGRYYSKVIEHKGTSVRLVLIDTTPLISKYRMETINYPDAQYSDAEKQIAWIDSTLSVANEDWIIVVGHHPIFAHTTKDVDERVDLQQRIDGILRKHNVDVYACGHIHNFQHIRKADSNIDYVVNSSASKARDVEPIEGTQFCSPAEGFSILSINKKHLRLSMIDSNGSIIYSLKRDK